MTKQKLPLGIVDFHKLRTPDEAGDSYVYVDKTEQIHQLVNGSVFNFLTRPRRFGKSLLHSVLYHLFNGDRELFEGLWIAQEDRWNWNIKRPVVLIDFNVVEKQDENEANPVPLAQALNLHIADLAQANGLELSKPTPGGKLQELIALLKEKTGQNVVVLIDEYDKPIVNHLEGAKREQAEINRVALRNFYSVLKANQTPLHFVLLTGVSKFGKLSIFSDLSNLSDLSIDKRFATLLGYSREEIERYFTPWLQEWAAQEGIPLAELWTDLKEWYNGYSWNGSDFMYNPWSVLSALQGQAIRGFWSTSGTPKMLVDLVTEKQVDLPALVGQWVRADVQERTSLEAIDPTALFWQTGYLTIKEQKGAAARKRYRLGLPNREVRESFLLYYLEEQQAFGAAQGSQLADNLYEALEANDLEGFMAQVSTLLAKVPYQLYPKQPQENYFHTIVFLAAMLSGHQVASEVSMSGGRIDTVIETADTFYVFEFKLDRHSVQATAQEALQQIEERGYTKAYANQGKKVVAVGVAFNAETRSIAEWKGEVVKE